MPIPRISSHRCHTHVLPNSGQWNVGSKVWPYASNPQGCTAEEADHDEPVRQPTVRNFCIRVCAR